MSEAKVSRQLLRQLRRIKGLPYAPTKKMTQQQAVSLLEWAHARDEIKHDSPRDLMNLHIMRRQRGLE